MKIYELIEVLSQYNESSEVLIYTIDTYYNSIHSISPIEGVNFIKGVNSNINLKFDHISIGINKVE